MLINHGVIPAKAGTSVFGVWGQTEIPAFAGMTWWLGGSEDILGSVVGTVAAPSNTLRVVHAIRA